MSQEFKLALAIIAFEFSSISAPASEPWSCPLQPPAAVYETANGDSRVIERTCQSGTGFSLSIAYLSPQNPEPVETFSCSGSTCYGSHIGYPQELELRLSYDTDGFITSFLWDRKGEIGEESVSYRMLYRMDRLDQSLIEFRQQLPIGSAVRFQKTWTARPGEIVSLLAFHDGSASFLESVSDLKSYCEIGLFEHLDQPDLTLLVPKVTDISLSLQERISLEISLDKYPYSISCIASGSESGGIMTFTDFLHETRGLIKITPADK